jgi:cobalamin synthase
VTDPAPGEGGEAARDAVDVRTDRVVQATVGVLLLAAFVFRLPWLPPILAIALACGALAGPPANPFHWAFTTWISPRLPAAEGTVPASVVKAQDALEAVILLVGALFYAMGLAPPAWLLTIVAAIIAIVAATTRVHLGDELRHVLRR